MCIYFQDFLMKILTRRKGWFVACPLSAKTKAPAKFGTTASNYTLTCTRTGWLGVTAVTILGLLKLNLFGDGMTESVKSMFREVTPEERRAIEAAKAPAAAAPEEKTE